MKVGSEKKIRGKIARLHTDGDSVTVFSDESLGTVRHQDAELAQ